MLSFPGKQKRKFFIALSRLADGGFGCGTVWDKSTRKMITLKSIAELIRKQKRWRCVLDAIGSSTYELQSAADSVRKG
jgi:hypothetical protein